MHTSLTDAIQLYLCQGDKASRDIYCVKQRSRNITTSCEFHLLQSIFLVPVQTVEKEDDIATIHC